MIHPWDVFHCFPMVFVQVKFMGQAVDDLSFYCMCPVGLYLGVVQYQGRIKVGICSDGQLEPEPKRLVDCWDEALRSFKEAL